MSEFEKRFPKPEDYSRYCSCSKCMIWEMKRKIWLAALKWEKEEVEKTRIVHALCSYVPSTVKKEIKELEDE